MQGAREEEGGIIGRYSQCLFRLMVIWIETVGRKLFNVTLGQPSQFSLPETLGEVQEGLGTNIHENLY